MHSFSHYLLNIHTRLTAVITAIQRRVPILEPCELLDYFELVTSLYIPDSGHSGILLNELVQKDWQLFSEQVLGQSANLLKAILDDDYYSGLFTPSSTSTELPVEQWDAFCSEIMCKNRFILDRQLDLERLHSLFNYLIHTEYTNTVLYRARMMSEN